jgi:hypothetical protein
MLRGVVLTIIKLSNALKSYDIMRVIIMLGVAILTVIMLNVQVSVFLMYFLSSLLELYFLMLSSRAKDKVLML